MAAEETVPLFDGLPNLDGDDFCWDGDDLCRDASSNMAVFVRDRGEDGADDGPSALTAGVLVACPFCQLTNPSEGAPPTRTACCAVWGMDAFGLTTETAVTRRWSIIVDATELLKEPGVPGRRLSICADG